jgi:serine/threonine-protein kinase
MPAVIGLSRAAATDALNHVHLAVGKTSQTFSDTVTSGLVISASETAGTKLRQNTTVDLVFSRDSADQDRQLRGQAGQGCRRRAETGRLQGDRDGKAFRGGPGRKVISQSPNSGAGVRGDEVKLVRSLGPVGHRA